MVRASRRVLGFRFCVPAPMDKSPPWPSGLDQLPCAPSWPLSRCHLPGDSSTENECHSWHSGSLIRSPCDVFGDDGLGRSSRSASVRRVDLIIMRTAALVSLPHLVAARPACLISPPVIASMVAVPRHYALLLYGKLRNQSSAAGAFPGRLEAVKLEPHGNHRLSEDLEGHGSADNRHPCRNKSRHISGNSIGTGMDMMINSLA